MTLRVSLRFSPDNVVPVGILSSSGRDTAFEYNASFLSLGLNPAPFRLPAKGGVAVFDRAGGMETFGMFEDSLPDGWGRRIVDVSFRKRHGRLPSVLERLACVGVSGMGALVYEPADETPEPTGELDLCVAASDAMDFDAGLLHADFRMPGEEYALLFRMADALTRDYSAKKELFRRTALNVIAHNRDDHLKNFGFLMDAHGRWSLAPFYDFTYAEGPNGWQTLSVAGEGENPGVDDLMRLADEVGVDLCDAEEIISSVKSACKALVA